MKKIYLLLLVILSLVSVDRIHGQALYDNKYLQRSIWSQLTQVDVLGNSYVASWNNSGLLTLMKLDMSGNIVWDKMFGKDPDSFRNIVFDMVITTHQKIVLAASFDQGAFSNYRQAAVICFDTTGTLLYTKVIGDTNEILSPNNIIADGDGYTMSMLDWKDTTVYGTRLIKFDENGIVLKERIIDRVVSAKIAKCPEGGYFLHESDWCIGIGKVDDNFMNESFTYTIFGISPSGLINTEKMISLTSKDSYVIGDIEYDTSAYDSTLGYYVDVPVYGAFIGHISENLICDWFKIFSVPDTSFKGHDFSDFNQLPDKSWMFVGTTAFNFLNEESYVNNFFLHTDSTFKVQRFVTAASDSEFYIDHNGNSTAGFLNDKVYFTNNYYDNYNYTGGIMFEVMKTDTSFGGFCFPKIDTVTTYTGYFNTFNGDDTTSFNDISRFITSLITPLSLPVSDLTAVYADCSDITLNTSQLFSNDDFRVYPNPTDGEISISSLNNPGDELTLSIFNIQGKLILQRNLHWMGNITLDVKTLASGIYFIQLVSSKNISVKKFVKE